MMKQLHVVIITHSHLCRNPRVLKEATALAELGHKVHILNSIYSKALDTEDRRLIHGINVKLESISDHTQNNMVSLIDKVVYRMSVKAVTILNLQLKSALGYGYSRYFRRAKQLKADLYICHQELPTVIGCKLIKEGYNVAFDFEDWYSQDLLPAQQHQRPLSLLKKVEKYAIENAAFSVTTSNALATALCKEYNTTRKINVIYNVFPKPKINLSEHKTFSYPIKLFWFSQTIGPGRGLEQFSAILNRLSVRVEVHLLGSVTITFQENLRSLISDKIPIFFHNLVEASILPVKISEFDVGLALELDTPLNRNYTITNKFFQYIQSGLPIIASKTCGQEEIFKEFNLGLMISQYGTDEDIALIDNWLKDLDALRLSRNETLKAAQQLNWEKQSLILENLITTTTER